MVSFTLPVTCLICKKFVGGLGVQGYKCQVCHYVAHKKCLSHCDEVTNCNTRFMDEDDSTLNKMNLKKKKKAVASLVETIQRSDEVPIVKVNILIVLLSSDIENLDNDDNYECFSGKKLLTENPNLSTDSSFVTEDGTWDVLELLTNYIVAPAKNKQIADTRRFISIKILDKILTTNEKAKSIMITSEHLSKLSLSLVYNLEEHDYDFYIGVLQILKTCLDSTKRRKLFFRTGSLDKIVEFLHSIVKLIEKRKEKRPELKKTKLTGAEILSSYYQQDDARFKKYIEQKMLYLFS